MPSPKLKKIRKKPASPPVSASVVRRRGRPPSVDRGGLLDAAERAIRRAGPSVSLDRIAAEAGVTKPVLFAHVGDRHAIVRALSQRLLARIDAASQEAIGAAAPGREALAAMLRATLETIAAHRHLYAFVNGASGGDVTLAHTLEFARRSATPIKEGTAAARSRSGLDPAPAQAWGYAIVGALHMVGLWWLNDPTVELEAPQLAEQLTALLFDGLALSPPSVPAKLS